MQLAYTIGNQVSYDYDLATKPIVRKIGWQEMPGADPYPGGWVWKTIAEAQAFLAVLDAPWVGAVYEICLPTDWNTDVNPIPGPDGVHNLLHDSVILRRV